VPTVRHSRDPRPIGDKAFAAQCARNVVEFLGSRSYGKVSYDKLLKDPSTRDFFEIFRFLMAQIDPCLEIEGRLEDEVPAIMRRLKYPVEVNRSKLQAISGPNTWPQLLAVLDWLVTVVRVNEDLVEPLALCELGLTDANDGEHEIADHQLLRSMQENYVQYLGNNDDNSDEERLRQIYEERLAALRGEIERLQEQHAAMEQRLQDFHSEHERLIELQREPASLELEAERLRSGVQAAEAKVQQLEDETGLAEADEAAKRTDLEDLQATLQHLTEQVESQAYSKKDIERLKCERGQLRQVRQDLQADIEKVDQDIWELGMKESNWLEAIGRLVRQVNESVESLGGSLADEEGVVDADLRVPADLRGMTDALAAQDFERLCQSMRDFAASRGEAVQTEEAALHSVLEEQRVVQEDLSEKERECRRLKVRFEQLQRLREEQRRWSAEQLDEAQRTAEATEDAVHAVAVGAAAPSLRDAAEVDRLRMELNEEKIRFANERAQIQERTRRDGERFEAHKKLVAGELEAHARETQDMLEDVEALLGDEPMAQGRLALGLGRLGGS